MTFIYMCSSLKDQFQHLVSEIVNFQHLANKILKKSLYLQCKFISHLQSKLSKVPITRLNINF